MKGIRLFLKIIFLGLLLKMPVTGNGQVVTKLIDTVKASLYAKPKFFLGFDTRRSFISSRDVKIFGIRAGFEFGGRIRVGIGFYGLASPFYRNFIITDTAGTDTIPAKMNFSYVSFLAEYIFVKKKRWEVSMPFCLGLGTSYFEGFQSQTHGRFVLGEVILQTQYKIFPWIGLGAGVGYRQMLIPNLRLHDEDFNSAIYIFKIKIFMGAIIKGLFPKKPKEQEKKELHQPQLQN